MAQQCEQDLPRQPQMTTLIMARWPLLVASGVVRKCAKEPMRTKLKNRMAKWAWPLRKSG
jgi:hypothetical protein